MKLLNYAVRSPPQGVNYSFKKGRLGRVSVCTKFLRVMAKAVRAQRYVEIYTQISVILKESLITKPQFDK